jgi:hypothetical protein
MSHVTKSKSPNFGALPIYVDHLPQKKCWLHNSSQVPTTFRCSHVQLYQWFEGLEVVCYEVESMITIHPINVILTYLKNRLDHI